VHAFGTATKSFEPHATYEPDLMNPVTHGVHLDYPLRRVEGEQEVWTRTCPKCRLVQRTTKPRETTKVTHEPAFP
jgi:hypothetical protein